MTGVSPGDSDREAPHGWEVEYAIAPTSFDKSNVENVRQTNHPGADSAQLEATEYGGQVAPALVLYDADGSTIAFYAPGTWLACRKNARAQSDSGSTHE